MKDFILKQLGYLFGGAVVVFGVTALFFSIGLATSKLFASFTPGECTISFLLVALLFVMSFIAVPKINTKK